jgi:hypothetical protein
MHTVRSLTVSLIRQIRLSIDSGQGSRQNAGNGKVNRKSGGLREQFPRILRRPHGVGAMSSPKETSSERLEPESPAETAHPAVE